MKRDYEYLRYLHEYRGRSLEEISREKKVSLKLLQKRALREGWRARSVLDRLMSISDKLECSIERSISEDMDVKNYKDITLAIKEAVAIRRNLCDLPTLSEESSLALAREKLELDRAKLSCVSASEKGEVTGQICVSFTNPEFCE